MPAWRPTMSNDPRPAKPPFPLLKRPKSGTMSSQQRPSSPSSDEVPRSPKETGRSGTIAKVRPEAALAAPRPTNLLRELEKKSASSTKADLSPPPFSEVSAAPVARRREPVLRRLDPGFTAEDEDRESWERAGTLLYRAPYRDMAETIPSPEELEARLLAELTETDPLPAQALPTRAHFEPAPAPALSVSPIIELEKAAAVMLDPLELTGAPKARAVLELVDPTSVLPPPIPVEGSYEAMPVAPEPLAASIDSVAHAPDVDAEGELESEPSERSRITVPPARRRRSPRSRFRSLLGGMVLLVGLGAAGWYRYPTACEQGLQLATTELTSWQRALAHQWSLGMRALGR